MTRRACERCGGRLATRRLARWADEQIGFPGVVLIDAVEEDYCTRCGRSDGVTIPCPEGLLATIALTRLTDPVKLPGSDLRFIRRVLEWTAEQLARRLGVSRESVSRWETGKERMGTTSEKLFRVLAGLHLVEAGHAPLATFDTESVEALDLVSRPVRRRPVERRFRLVRSRRGGARGGAYETDAA